MTKKILAYGFDLPVVDGFEPVSIISGRSMLDADIIAIEPDISLFDTSESYQGLPLMTEQSSALYRQTKARWKDHLDTAMRSGRNVFFFLRDQQKMFYYTGERKNVGTAGRPRMQQSVTSCSNYDFIPLKMPNLSVADGSAFKVAPDGVDLLSNYWKQFSNNSTYRCYFSVASGWKTLLWTKGGEHAVGAIIEVGQGKIVLLPEITWGHLGAQGNSDDENVFEDEDAHGWSSEHIQFAQRLRDVLLSLDRSLKSTGDQTNEPDWIGEPKYKLESEIVIESEMRALAGQMEIIRERYAELDVQRIADGSIRDLLFETGRRLEDAVRDALRCIGFEVCHFDEAGSEFDAIFLSDEGRFIGEVEGRDSKAIDIAKASQLHRNLTEDFAREEVNELAIGVLFGNAYRLIAPDQRQATFTAKVLTFAQSAGLVLVETPKLFAMAQHIKNTGSEEFARRCRQALVDGKGRVVEFPEITRIPPSQLTEVE